MNETVINILPTGLRRCIEWSRYEKVEEIRLRVGRNVILHMGDREQHILDYVVSASDLQETMEYITNFSIYAYESEIKEGFITIKGGHRVGLAGKVIYQEGKITTISPISSINIRVSHQIIGCGDKVMKYIIDNGTYLNTLIISPPGHGKTTMLRDIVRQLSDVHKMKISVIDERSEIASCYKGIPQNDIGQRSDVYDCCYKREGIMLMIRAMSPQVVAVDELGRDEDIRAILEASRCGCKILATVHGEGADNFVVGQDRDANMRDIFDRYVVINKDMDRSVEVYDRHLRRLE